MCYDRNKSGVRTAELGYLAEVGSEYGSVLGVSAVDGRHSRQRRMWKFRLRVRLHCTVPVGKRPVVGVIRPIASGDSFTGMSDGQGDTEAPMFSLGNARPLPASHVHKNRL